MKFQYTIKWVDGVKRVVDWLDEHGRSRIAIITHSMIELFPHGNNLEITWQGNCQIWIEYLRNLVINTSVDSVFH